MSNIMNRMQDTTPKFFKILRNIGVALAAVSAAVFASPVVLYGKRRRCCRFGRKL